MKKLKKNDIITFKIDESLKECLSNVENRSEFIRKAILNSCQCLCPLCNGSGRLSPELHEKWLEIKIIVEHYLNNDLKLTELQLPQRAEEIANSEEPCEKSKLC